MNSHEDQAMIAEAQRDLAFVRAITYSLKPLGQRDSALRRVEAVLALLARRLQDAE